MVVNTKVVTLVPSRCTCTDVKQKKCTAKVKGQRLQLYTHVFSLRRYEKKKEIPSMHTVTVD